MFFPFSEPPRMLCEFSLCRLLLMRAGVAEKMPFILLPQEALQDVFVLDLW